jgi:hypothetical protein
LRGECCIKIVDVCLMVLVVVEGHDLLADVRFQGLEKRVRIARLIEREESLHREHMVAVEECTSLTRPSSIRRLTDLKI